jgi:methylmalonyl-CoA/ethylmalonyl-CoA epimerase
MTLQRLLLEPTGAIFDHVGVAVSSIAAIDDTLSVVDDPRQRVGVAFTEWAGLRVELIEPRGGHSPVMRNLERQQPLAHVCFRVRDIDAAINVARQGRLHCIARPCPATAFGGRRIAWLFSPTYGLVELLEDPACTTAPAASNSGGRAD